MVLPAVQPTGDLLPSWSGEGWERWLGGYRPATQAAYRSDVEEWMRYCSLRGTDPLTATRGDTTAWIAHLTAEGRTPATIARKVAALASLYAWARDEELTVADPVPRRRPKVPTDDGLIRGLDAAQARALLAAAGAWGQRDGAFVTLLLTCGLRVSEALEADVTDLQEIQGHRVLTVMGKGAKPRTIALPPSAWHALSGYLDGRSTGPLFITASGRRWDRVAAARSLRRLGHRVGLPDLHPHQLRHTAATLALDAGAPLDRVQALLGHADPRTTMRYVAARERLDTSASYDVARLLSDD